MKIVIVEDEAIVTLFIRRIAEEAGHTVVGTFTNAADACAFVRRTPADLVFMDINIEGGADGIQCAREMLAVARTGIAYVSAYDDPQTLESAIDANTVGFFPKPLSESDVRIALLLARHRRDAANTVRVRHSVRFADAYRFVCEENRLETRRGTIELTPKELKVLKMLMHEDNKVIDSETIAQTLYAEEHGDASAVRNLIHRLRQKLPDAIETVPGCGYRLKAVRFCD